MVPVNPHPSTPRWIHGGKAANCLMWKEKKKSVIGQNMFLSSRISRNGKDVLKSQHVSAIFFFFSLSCQFICGAGGHKASAHCLHSWIYAAGVRPQHQQMYCVSINVETCSLQPRRKVCEMFLNESADEEQRCWPEIRWIFPGILLIPVSCVWFSCAAVSLPASTCLPPRSLALMSTAARGRDSEKKERKGKKRTKASLFVEQDYFCVTANHTVTHFLVPLLKCCPFVGFSDLWEVSCVVTCVWEQPRMGKSHRVTQAPEVFFLNLFLITQPHSGGCYVTWLSGVTLVRHFDLAGCTTLSVKHRCRFTRRKYNTVIITNNTVIHYSGTMRVLL